MQDEPKIVLPDNDEQPPHETAQPQVKLTRRKRGIGPIGVIACAPGFKLVGDDCSPADIDFE